MRVIASQNLPRDRGESIFALRGIKMPRRALWEWSGEGAKGLLDRGSEKPLAPVQPGVAHRCKQGCTWCQRLLGDLCGVGPKDLLLRLTFPEGPKIEKIQSRLKFSISLENFNLD